MSIRAKNARTYSNLNRRVYDNASYVIFISKSNVRVLAIICMVQICIFQSSLIPIHNTEQLPVSMWKMAYKRIIQYAFPVAGHRGTKHRQPLQHNLRDDNLRLPFLCLQQLPLLSSLFMLTLTDIVVTFVGMASVKLFGARTCFSSLLTVWRCFGILSQMVLARIPGLLQLRLDAYCDAYFAVHTLRRKH